MANCNMGIDLMKADKVVTQLVKFGLATCTYRNLGVQLPDRLSCGGQSSDNCVNSGGSGNSGMMPGM